jgi:hypothetical protein
VEPRVAATKRRKKGVTPEEYHAMALSFPGVEAGMSYGVPSFKLRGKFFSRLREDGETVVITPVHFEERDMMVQTAPDVFYFTDHYKNYPAVLVRLPNVKADDLRMLLEQSWRRKALKRAVIEYDAKTPALARRRS